MSLFGRIVFVGLAVMGLGLASCGEETDLKNCTGPQDCLDGYACDTQDTKVCLVKCSTQNECLNSQYCKIPTGETSGVCRYGTVP